MHKRIGFLLLCLTGVAAGYGQDPQSQKGSVFREKNSEINFNTGDLPAATVAQLKASIEKIRPVVCQAGPLQPPVGFDAVWKEFALSIPRNFPWQKQPPVVVVFGLPEYYLDGHSNSVKQGSEAFADISVEVNSFRNVFADTYGHDLDAAGYPCPAFFFLYNQQTADSSHDYVEYTQPDGSTPFRVITNGKPLYVPFTREQYLTFQIRSDKAAADAANRRYVHDSITIANIPGKKDIMKGEADLVDTWRQRMDKHRQQLAALSADQRKQPALIVYGSRAAAGDRMELTADGDPEGQELWTINPDYFNKGLPSAAIQVIVVSPEYARIASPFIKAKVMELYRAIDYKALRTLIQN